MNKLTVLALGLIFVLPSFANAAGLQVGLRCEGVSFVAGDQNFNRLDSYFPSSVAAGSSTSSNATTTFVDFSEGDQVATYEFKSSDLASLTAGKTATVTGFYEDGFYWSNGYNTRARFSVNCSRAK